MQTHDIQSILSIQALSYPALLHESATNLLAKLEFSPHTCWVAENNAHILAYLFSHPWVDSCLPDLDSPMNLPTDKADIFFIHDLALHPQARGLGLARHLIQTALQWAQQHSYHTVRLIAVENSGAFWRGMGFSHSDKLMAFQEKVRAYGAAAQCMQTQLAPKQQLSNTIHIEGVLI